MIAIKFEIRNPVVENPFDSWHSLFASEFTMKLYVGNLTFDATESDLRGQFEQFGKVVEVAMVTDRETGRSRGFAFVTMGSAAEGQAAIAALEGKDFQGRKLTVNEARPREDRPQGGGGGGRSFGGGGGGGGRSSGGGSRGRY